MFRRLLQQVVSDGLQSGVRVSHVLFVEMNVDEILVRSIAAQPRPNARNLVPNCQY